METSTAGIDFGFATLHAVAFPHMAATVGTAAVTVEFALRGRLLIGAREIHPDEVIAHPGGELVACPAWAGSTQLAVAIKPEAEIAQRFLARLRRAEIVRLAALPRFRLAFSGEMQTDDSQRSIALGGLVMHLVADCLRALRAEPASAVRAVVDILDCEFRGTVSLTELAARVGMRPSTLATRFQREIGMSVGAYVRQRRVELARRMLVESEMPIAEIARAAGFYDQSHFDRCFRKISGSTPAAFRRAAAR